MQRWILLVGALALVGCGDGDGGGLFGGGGGGGGGGGRTTGFDEVPNSAELMRTEEGDLADGAPESSLDFLESASCVPATQFEKFDGHWVWYTYEQPAGKQVYVAVDPDSGVDVSLIVSQNPEGTSGSGSSGVSGLCEEGLDYSGPNSGQVESVKVTSVNNGYHLVIGVAGAFGEDEGGFELSIFEE